MLCACIDDSFRVSFLPLLKRLNSIHKYLSAYIIFYSGEGEEQAMALEAPAENAFEEGTHIFRKTCTMLFSTFIKIFRNKDDDDDE